MLKFLVVLEFNRHISANIIISGINWQLNNVSGDISHLPEFIPTGWIECDFKGRRSAKTEQRRNFILPYIITITI
jgi:hypothetical protein